MPKWLLPVGRIFYAVGLIGIGVQHFIFRDFIPVIVALWPAWMPGRPFWACLVGAALVCAGVAILFDIKGRAVAVVTGAMLVVVVIVAHIPRQLMGHPGNLVSWADAFTALTLAGGAWITAMSIGDAGPKLPGSLEKILPAGRFFFAIMLIVFGIDHFFYTAFVATLVPAWIPGHVFWTYFAGVALIAGGVGMFVRFTARLASLMVGIMIFLWFLMLHIPRAVADPHSGLGGEWTSAFEALAFSGIAFMLAALPESDRSSTAKIQN
jgi:uncharacterized membrane protein YphA (DoxX/SURF4 family)